MAKKDYIRVQYAQPHPQRTRKMLKAHPELSKLVGCDPRTFFYLLLIVGMQLAIAAFIGNYPWWAMIVIAWTVGAVANHACLVINHDATHNLVLKGNTANLITQVICNMPFFFPSAAICFRYYHLHHHRYQGQMGFDGDLAGPIEAKIFGNTVIGKITWLFFFSLIEGITRPLRIGKKIKVINAWVIGSFIYQVILLIVLGWAFGWEAPTYLALSTAAAVGLHPLGARWIQEHYVFKDGQETYSYYGPFNKLMFNVGYHNEDRKSVV
jgi:sphingolipid delta-4 desaturase